MFKENPLPIILFSCFVVLVTAVMQYQQPEYSFFYGGYIIAILLTIFLKDDGYTRIFGFFGLTMVLVSSFYPDSTIPSTQLLLQHLFSGVVIIMTMIAAVLACRKIRGGSGFHLALAFIIGVAFILFDKFAMVFSTKGNLPPLIAAWIPDIIFAIVALWLYKKAPK